MENMKKILEEKRPNKWKDIPDIELYMDQVLNYMKRQHIGLELDETLTGAMINNYIKKGLLPRANGKKYNKEHIAWLTAICLAKQVLSVDDTGKLLSSKPEGQSGEALYDKYTKILDEEFFKVSQCLDENLGKEEQWDLAIRLAVSSYAQKLACQAIIQSLNKEE